MKRIIAVLVDEVISLIISIMLIEVALFMDINIQQNFLTKFILIVCMGYVFFCDYFLKGMTLGKRLTNTKVYFLESPPDYLEFAFIHGLCRVLLFIAGPIGMIVYSWGNGKMPYEEWVHVEIK